jgi:RecB family exonuclease
VENERGNFNEEVKKGRKKKYENDFPSVTQILSVIEKPALKYWYINNTKEFIDEELRKAKDVGSQIHELIEKYIKGETPEISTQYYEETKNAALSFLEFKKAYPTLNFLETEVSLTHSAAHYNGTIDAIAKDSDGNTVLLDWKTGKCKDEIAPPFYETMLLQVSAYMALLCDDRGNNKDAYALVISLGKDKVGYNVMKIPYVQLYLFFNVFIKALELYSGLRCVKNFIKENKNDVTTEEDR